MKKNSETLILLVLGLIIVLTAVLLTKAIFVICVDTLNWDYRTTSTITNAVLLLFLTVFVLIKYRQIAREQDEIVYQKRVRKWISSTGYIFIFVGTLLSLNQETWKLPSILDEGVCAFACILVGWSNWLNFKEHDSKFFLGLVLIWVVLFFICLALAIRTFI